MPRSRRDLAERLALVALAVAGLLSMHGFDGAAASLSGPSHISAEEDTGHGALGICVFVMAIAGLGMAILVAWPRGRLRASRIETIDTAPGHQLPGAGGRSRLALLCVLRL